jgi:hypothetical protein
MGPVRCANGDYTALGPHAGAADCFNRPTATDMAGTVTAGDTSVAFTAVDGQIVTLSLNSTNATFTGTDRNTAQALKLALNHGNCHFRHAPRSGPIVSALKNAGHTDRKR